MPRLLAIAWLSLVGLAALGLGRLLRRVAGQAGGTSATTLGLGLAALVAVGGVLDLLRIAFAPVLVAVVAAGVVLALPALRDLPRRLPPGRAARLELLLAGGVVAAAVGLAAATLAPPRVFNFHDDLQKYLAHPARMLATGTLAATPLSALGFETLGGQAFLQGLLVAALPLPFAGALEPVLGLALLLALSAAAGWRRLPRFPAAAVGPVLVATVNAQVVNVSALYTAAALMATAVLLAADDQERSPPAPLALGVTYAAMVALKPTFLLFAALHLPLAALAVHGRDGGRRRALAWAARVALAAAVCLAPWVLLHAPVYLGARSALPPAPPGWDDPFGLLSPAPLFYGTTALHYAALGAAALGAAGAGAAALGRGARGPEARRAKGVAAAAVPAVVATLLLVFVSGPLHTGHEVGLRYALPFLLGAAVPAIPLALGLPARWPRAVPAALVGAAVGVSAAFAPVALDRARQAIAHGTVLAFRGAPGYRPYTAYALSDAARARVARFQERVPAGEPLLAWIDFPFHLDLRRNDVEVVEPTAFGTPWARLPARTAWVLWQYRGFATRTPEYLAGVARGPGAHERRTALRIAAFSRELARLVAGGSVVADDGEIRLVRLGAQEAAVERDGIR